MHASFFNCSALATLLFASSSWAYEIEHPYRIELKDDEEIRAAWRYHVRATAWSRGAARDHERRRGTEGPFQDLFGALAFGEDAIALSGTLAFADAKAEMTFSSTAGGKHRVSGDAVILGQGRFARSYAQSTSAFNVGKTRNGRIRWSPRWKTDTIRGGRTVSRDPIDLTLRDLDSGVELSDRFLEIHFDSSSGGEGSWEDGQISIRGVDGEFWVNMDSPYLTTPGGSMYMKFDAAGRVTESEDSGLFDGYLPAVGELAVLNNQFGDADGGFDVGFDFSALGQEFGDNLDLSGDLSGDGMTQVYADDAGLVQDFSLVQVADREPRLVGGTMFQPQLAGPPRFEPLLMPSMDDADPFGGFMRLTDQGDVQKAVVSFDASQDRPGDRIRADFDFRMNNQFGGLAEGMSFALLPTDLYGETGPVAQPEDFELGLNEAIVLKLDTLHVDPQCEEEFCFGEQANHISLLWNGEEIAQQQLDPGQMHLQNGEWNAIGLEIEQADDGVFLTATVTDGSDGSEHQVFDRQFVEGALLESVRAALHGASFTGVTQDVDNVSVYWDGGPVLPFCNPTTQGDVNGDGVVNFGDFLIVSANFGRSVDSHELGDINCNGEVDFSDFLELSGNFGVRTGVVAGAGGPVAVPEPSMGCLALFGFSGLLGWRRKRS